MNAAVLQPAEQALTQKIRVRNLNFYYGGFHALKNINLEIPEKKVSEEQIQRRAIIKI